MQKLIFGCGYLGRRVANAWLKQGHHVTAVTRSQQHAEELAAANITPIIADVTEPNTLQQFLITNPATFDTVLFAIGYDRTAIPSKRDVYITGLKNTLHAIGGRVKRFIHISSTSVYGQNNGEQVDETSRCQPTTESGLICQDAEQIVQHFFKNESAKSANDQSATANILRFAGIYGPQRLLRRIEQLQINEPIKRNPNGFLNLIHVDDGVAAILACEQQAEPNQTYLICDDTPLPRRDYYETLAKLAGTAPPKFAEINNETTQQTDTLNKRCSNRKMHDELKVTLHFPNAKTGLQHALSAT